MKKYNINTPITFKKGLYQLNDIEIFNYQLSRIVNWNRGDLEDLKVIGPKIKNFKDWKKYLLELAKKAESEERIENAIGYYRMADF